MAKLRNHNPKSVLKTPYKSKVETKLELWGSKDFTMPKKPEALKLLKEVRDSTKRRIESLKKYDYFSYAAEQTTAAFKKMYFKEPPDIYSLKWEQIEKELRIYHNFWGSKTSTKKGARDETLRQSERIFGVDKNKRLNKVFTKQEAKAYWDAYDLFYEVHSETARYDSTRIQVLLGEELQTFYKDANVDMLQVLEKIKKQLDIEGNLGRSLSETEKQEFDASFNKVLEIEHNEDEEDEEDGEWF